MQINIQINECLPVCCVRISLQAFPNILASGQDFEIILCFLMIRLKSSLVSIMTLPLHIALWRLLFTQWTL